MNQLDRLTSNELRELLKTDGKPCVSLFVPTCRSGREMMQGPIRLKNLLSQAETRLKRRGQRWDKIQELLSGADDLIGRTEFWERQTEGFAYFSAPGVTRRFQLPIRVPEGLFVGDRFHVTPLLPIFMDDGRFYILTLSGNHPSLYEATRYTIHHIDVPDMPRNIDEALWGDVHAKQSQRRTAAHPSAKGRSGAGFQYSTGPGTDMEKHKSDLKRFFDLLDAALEPIWHRSPAPVVLAGVRYEIPIFRQASSSRLLLPGEVHGSFDRASTSELHERAWKIARIYFEREEDSASQKFRDLLGSGRTASSKAELDSAARTGRIETLFLREDESIVQNGRASAKAALNDLALEVMNHGGRVFVLSVGKMPAESSAAAILRY